MENSFPWTRFVARMFRQFHADVIVNAPKDRTLFNYNIKDGWPKLAQFLEIEGKKYIRYKNIYFLFLSE